MGKGKTEKMLCKLIPSKFFAVIELLSGFISSSYAYYSGIVSSSQQVWWLISFADLKLILACAGVEPIVNFFGSFTGKKRSHLDHFVAGLSAALLSCKLFLPPQNFCFFGEKRFCTSREFNSRTFNQWSLGSRLEQLNSKNFSQAEFFLGRTKQRQWDSKPRK